MNIKEEAEKHIRFLKEVGPGQSADFIRRQSELLEQMAEALEAAKRMNAEALPKFNWAASFLDANAIQLLNEVPGKVTSALAAYRAEQS